MMKYAGAIMFCSIGSAVLFASPNASLVEAVHYRKTAIVASLLAANADLAGVDAMGNSALHWAALNGDLAGVRDLLARGAKVDAINHSGATPLIFAVANVEVVEALLARGADVNHAAKSGTTALMAAARRARSAAVVRVLLAHKADINVAIPDEGSALDVAAGNDDRETVGLLLAAGAKPRDLTLAAVTGDCSLVTQLLDAGAPINFDAGFAGHALNFALYSHHPEVAKLLVERGADLTFRSPMGEHKTPPILWAANTQYGDASVARLMLAHGADPNLLSERGESALDWARARHNQALEKVLLDAGGRPGSAVVKLKEVPHRSLPSSPAEVSAVTRDALARSLPLLQRASDGFLQSGVVRQHQCVSCHHETLPAVAFAWARERGLRLDDVSIARQAQDQVRYWRKNDIVPHTYERVAPQPDVPVLVGYGIQALAAYNYPPDDLTEAMVWYLMDAQLPDGSWANWDYRPPMEDGPIPGAAFAIRSLQLYPLPGREQECRDRVDRARRWLVRATPQTFNQRVFQLLGLGWAGEPPSAVRPLVQTISHLQRADGGWAQLDGFDSDAWATGQTLVALQTAGGMATSDPVYQRGVAYLLRTQFADGSWYVHSRVWPFQPQFDSGFPHGRDQWISAGATAWATMALLLTQPVTEQAATVNWMAMTVPRAPAEKVSDQSPAPRPVSTVSYVRDIQPILDRSCSDCHGGDNHRGKFSLATREGLLKGGESGDAVVAVGDGAHSQLIAMVSDQIEDSEMPPLNKRARHPALNAGEIALLRAWIDAGVPWATGPAVKSSLK